MDDSHTMLSNRGRSIVLSIILTLSALPTFAQQEDPEHTLLDHLRVIVGDGSVLTNAAVLIHGDTIVAVGEPDEMSIPPGTRRINLEGKTLMPTLIDAHTHLGYAGLDSWGAENYTLENLIANLNTYAWYGFGAVFSAGSDPASIALELQRRQANGEVGGAHFLFAAGMAPPGQGPNNQFLVETQAIEERTGTTIVHGLANESDATTAVQIAAERGIRFIKLWVDDRGGSQEKLSAEIYRAAIAEARRKGMSAVVHQQYASDMLDLIDAGVRGFLHGRVESGFSAEIANAAGQNNVFIVPNLGLAELRREAIGTDPFLSTTLSSASIQRLSPSSQRLESPVRNPEMEQTLHDSFQYMLNANVDIVLGSDAGAVPDHPYGYSGHRELEIFVRHGMSTAQALDAATRVAAEVLDLDRNGQIESGFRADLLILDQNPLDDIRNTRTIHQVYIGGQLLDRS